LPSETAFEPYFEEAQQLALFRMLRNLVREMDSANILVLYGLSLSPLDAELSLWLSMGLDNSKINRIYVVDPQHTTVISRLSILLTAETSERGDLQIVGAAPAEFIHGETNGQ
jgi:hypothetical protein